MTPAALTTRAEARTRILEAANKHRRIRNLRNRLRGADGRGFLAPPLHARHLHDAVAIVRHHGLVGPDVLELAGFRAHKWKRSA